MSSHDSGRRPQTDDNPSEFGPQTGMPPENPEPDSAPAPGPWGFWATLGLTGLIVVAYFASAIGAIVPFLMFPQESTADGPPTAMSRLENLQTDGDYLSLCIVLSAVVCSPMCVLFAAIRKGFPLRDYMGFRMVSPRRWLIWLGVTAAYVVLADATLYATKSHVVPEFMAETYRSTRYLPLLYIAFVLAAPLFEEFLFRGFLFQGIRYSKLGTVSAVVLTTLCWSLLHVQYDWVGITSIALIGVLLAAARLKTDSIWVPVAMHALVNLVATIEAAVYVQYFA